MVGRVLNHSQPSVTAVYTRLDLEPVRPALEANTQAMLEVERAAAELGRNVAGAVDSEGDHPIDANPRIVNMNALRALAPALPSPARPPQLRTLQPRWSRRHSEPELLATMTGITDTFLH